MRTIIQFFFSLADRLCSRAWNLVGRIFHKRVHEGITLGLAVRDGKISKQKVLLAHIRRPEHLAILGKTGVGKSYFLRSLIKQDIEARNGLVIFDIHGDLTPYVLSVIAEQEQKTKEDLSERVIVIDPSDEEYSCGLNLLEQQPNQNVYRLISEFTDILQKRWGQEFGPRTLEALNASLHALSEAGQTLLELPPLLTNASFRAKCLKQVSNNEVKAYFLDRFNQASEAMQATISAPVLNKITGFTVDPKFRHLVGQARSTFSVRDVLEQNLILVVNLAKGKLGEQALTFGSLLFAKLKSAIFARKTRSLLSLYLDEVQNLVVWDASLEVLLSECRKFNVSVVTANQYLEQLPAIIRAALEAIGSHIYFQVSPSDAQAIAKHNGGGKPFSEQLQNLPHQHFLLKISSQSFRHIHSLPIKPPQASYQELYSRCQQRFMRKRSEIETEILRRIPAQKVFAEAINDWE